MMGCIFHLSKRILYNQMGWCNIKLPQLCFVLLLACTDFETDWWRKPFQSYNYWVRPGEEWVWIFIIDLSISKWLCGAPWGVTTIKSQWHHRIVAKDKYFYCKSDFYCKILDSLTFPFNCVCLCVCMCAHVYAHMLCCNSRCPANHFWLHRSPASERERECEREHGLVWGWFDVGSIL